ncbi:MAG: HAD-IA family hydrolase [Candidatus Pacebacteria bacterium]|nr:HAD-IA family hydrolase [Candidatus Paceibacterota bacterium]
MTTHQDIEKLAAFINQNKKDRLVFDMDGTLLKLEIDWEKWHHQTAAICQEFESDFEFPGLVMYNFVNPFIKKYGQAARQKFFELNQRYELANLKGCKRNQLLIEFAQTSSAKKFLFTSNSRQTADTVLAEQELTDLFETTVTRDDVELIKPDPDGMKHIYQPGQDKDRFLMIGDTQADQGLAENFGIDYWQVKMEMGLS